MKVTANVFDIETLLITEVFLNRIIKFKRTFFGIVEYEGIYDAIYLKSGVLIQDTTSLTANACLVDLYKVLTDTNSLTHVTNEMKIKDWCIKNKIVYPINDLNNYDSYVESV